MLLGLTDNRHQWATIRSEGCRSFICPFAINQFFMRVEKESTALHVCNTSPRLSSQCNVGKTISIIFRSINNTNFNKLFTFYLQNLIARSHNNLIQHNHSEISKYRSCPKHFSGTEKL